MPGEMFRTNDRQERINKSIMAIKTDSSGYRLFVWGAYQGTFETIYGAIEHAIQTIGKE